MAGLATGTTQSRMTRTGLGAVAYSITSSARASGAGGTVRPSALAVFEIDDQLERRWLFDRQVHRFRAFQDLLDVSNRASRYMGKAWAIADKASALHIHAARKNGGETMLNGELSDLRLTSAYNGVLDGNQSIRFRF